MSASALIRVLGLGLGLGLITVAMSELFFYPVDHLAAVPTLLAFYAPMALFGFAALERTGRWAFGPVVLSAAIFGWTVEGVLVTQAYEALPMSLIWTALSWHGVFTVGIAVIGLRCALLSSRIWVAPVACAVFGLFAALWGVFAWTTLLEPKLQAVIGHDFRQQLVLAVAMIALGHLVLDYTPARAPVGGWVLWVLALLALAVWSISWAVPLFPISLWVPLLIGASALALCRARAAPRAIPLGRVRFPRYLNLLLVPLIAIPLHEALMVEQSAILLELNVYLALPATFLAALLWAGAFLSGLLRPRS